MPKQFEDQRTNVEDKKIPDPQEEKQINEAAEDAAEKASRTEQNYDKNHEIFSK